LIDDDDDFFSWVTHSVASSSWRSLFFIPSNTAYFAVRSALGTKPGILPKISNAGPTAPLNSGRSSASSAKHLYMSKSRYMPGGCCFQFGGPFHQHTLMPIPGKNPLGSGQKENTPNSWNKPVFGTNNRPKNLGLYFCMYDIGGS
jgi:hypothetical protein